MRTDESKFSSIGTVWAPSDDTSSCFVRVGQSWAGTGWGCTFLPRVGMEVIVTFVDGDPDCPVVTGCLYNGSHSPPYSLPDDMTKTTIKTQSVPGGGGFNELRFEDLAGSEEIFMHAQKDHNVTVKGSQSTSVGGSQSTSVSGTRSTTVTGKDTVTVNNSREMTVASGLTETIGANQTVNIGANSSLTIGSSSTETITIAKALSIGSAYQVSVGGAMNETVGGLKAEEVGGIKTVNVGVSSSENVADKRRSVRAAALTRVRVKR